MNIRSTTAIVTFANPFVLNGYPDELPAGTYEVVVEEEQIPGLSFEAYRRTATFLTVVGTGNRAGRTELRPTTKDDLELALSQDKANVESIDSATAPSPSEENK